MDPTDVSKLSCQTRRFRKALCERLITSDILRVSHQLKNALGDQACEEIKCVEDNKGKTKAVDIFISYIEKSTNTEIWSIFKRTLEKEGYERVLKILKGKMSEEELLDDARHMKVLDHFRKQSLPVNDLIDRLVANGVLMDAHYEEIKAKREVPHSATNLLYDLLRRSKSPDWFALFLEAVAERDEDMAFEMKKYMSLVKIEIDCEYDYERISDDEVAMELDVDEHLVSQGNSSEAGQNSEMTCPDGTGDGLTLRSYQTELAAEAVSGRNCLIVAPTGSGKTYVAINIIQKHLQSEMSRNKKVVFLVPTVALADEQSLDIAKNLPQYRNKKIVGASANSINLWLMLDEWDIFVMTPQMLLDALNEKDDKLISKFTLLVFDECHHTLSNHPYAQIMGIYVDQKLASYQAPLPQIVGLTATVGVGKAKQDSEAVDHLLQLCANLDVHKICTVQHNIDEMREYVPVASQESVTVGERQNDIFGNTVKLEMKKIERLMAEKRDEVVVDFDVKPPLDKGSQDYVQWTQQLQWNLRSIKIPNDIVRYFNTCLEFLRIYYKGLSINSDARTQDALGFLKEKIESLDAATFEELDKQLKASYEENVTKLQMNCGSRDFLNPKLETLKSKILQNSNESSDFRGLIFAKTRALVHYLNAWANECPELKRLNPGLLVGQRGQDSGGLTLNQQRDALKCFKEGNYKLMFATSVAEEGLDIQECIFVIQYLYVGSVISTIQSRGRARAENSKYVSLVEEGKGSAEKDKLNIIKEAMMGRAIKELKDEKVDFQSEIRKRQVQGKSDRLAAATKAVERPKTEAVLSLLCQKCRKCICLSSDIRKLEGRHHVVIKKDFHNCCKIKPERRQNPYFQKFGKMVCVKCGYKWGSISKFKRFYCYVISIDSFGLENCNNLQFFKGWDSVPFDPGNLQEQDEDNIKSISMDITKKLVLL